MPFIQNNLDQVNNVNFNNENLQNDNPENYEDFQSDFRGIDYS